MSVMLFRCKVAEVQSECLSSAFFCRAVLVLSFSFQHLAQVGWHSYIETRTWERVVGLKILNYASYLGRYLGS